MMLYASIGSGFFGISGSRHQRRGFRAPSPEGSAAPARPRGTARGLRLFAAWIALSCASALNAPADGFPWPIGADNRVITSSFGEPRPGRFHCGVDFSSGGVIGKPVYALGDGWISRVATSPSGYGKLLEFTLDDGRVAAYAHLSGFPAAIEDSLETLRALRRTYEVEIAFRPGEFRAAKGEEICRSGDSGAGPPHLHLELRDSGGSPLDLLGLGLTVPDAVPPQIGDVVFIPLDRDALVDGSPVPRRAAGSSDEPAHLTGRVGVAAELVDRVVPSGYRLGVHRVELVLDTLVVFSKCYERIEMSGNRFGGMDYLSGWKYGVGGTLSALFRREGNGLDFYRGDGLPDVRADAPPTAHTLRIRVWDRAGNTAEKTIPVVFGARPAITACRLDPEGVLHLEGRAPSGGLARAELRIASRKGPGRLRSFPLTGSDCHLAESLGNAPATVTATLIDTGGSRSLPVTLRHDPSVRAGNGESLSLSTELHHDCLLVTVSTPSPPASLPTLGFRLDQGRPIRIGLTPSGTNAWTGRIPLEDRGACRIRIEAGALDPAFHEMTASLERTVVRLDSAAGTVVSAPDGRFALRGEPGGLYRPAPVAVDTAGVFQPEGLQSVSPAYRVEWGDDPVKGPFRAVFTLDAEVPVRAHVYVSGNGNHWRCLSGRRQGREISARFNGEGYIGVFVDETVPEVEILAPRSGGATGSRPSIRVRVLDRESGIGDSASVNLIVDGVPVYGEYDPEADEVRYTFRRPLAPGEHRLIVGAADRAWNHTMRQTTFIVK